MLYLVTIIAVLCGTFLGITALFFRWLSEEDDHCYCDSDCNVVATPTVMEDNYPQFVYNTGYSNGYRDGKDTVRDYCLCNECADLRITQGLPDNA